VAQIDGSADEIFWHGSCEEEEEEGLCGRGRPTSESKMNLIRMTLDFRHLIIDVTTETFEPDGAWEETGGRTFSARSWCEMRGRSASPGLLASPCIQLTNDPRTPAAAVQIQIDGGDANGFMNANGVFDPDSGGPQTITTQGYRFMRKGWAIKSASAGTSWGNCGGGIELRW
jgi:hypothetical protein